LYCQKLFTHFIIVKANKLHGNYICQLAVIDSILQMETESRK